ncbi:hypothetical protein GC173_09185 [bacterium]|nr:hypothetical protein [bacterium]
MFLTMMNMLKRRRGIPLDLFYTYWVNAHAAQIAARLPGIDHLWLHEISFEDGQIWPRTDGVEHELSEEHRFDGVPEPCFETEEHLAAFLAAMEPLMTDEANIFEETVANRSLGDNSKTFVDTTPPSFSAPGLLKFLLFLRRTGETSTNDFRAYLSSEMAPAWADVGLVRKLRLHLLEPHADDSDDVLESGVSTLAPKPRRYDAVVEIAFTDGLDLGRFVRSTAWSAGADGRAARIEACHAFKVNATHNLKRDGKLTFEGLRTPIVAQAIDRVGAISQFNETVLALQGADAH